MDNQLISVLKNGEPLVYKSCTAESSFKEQVMEGLSTVLHHFGKDHIYDHISYCLHELIDNACKANIKRVYFQEKEFDITDPEQYDSGMAQFKEDLLYHREHYLALLEPAGFWLSISYELHKDNLIIKVANSAPILPDELEKIYARIDKARVYESLAEIFEDISDDAESAGLGIVMLCMIIRKLGVTKNGFHIDCKNQVTTVTVQLPLSSVTDEDSETISDSLITAINTIPQFPENILKLKQLLAQKDFDTEKVVQLIKTDPALTAEILRMCNSAYYRRRNSIDNTRMAVSILGTRGLQAVLDSWGARKALEAQYPRKMLEPLWQHASEVAHITSILCKRYECDTQVTELAYNSALLHEIGRIVLQGNYSETYEEMKRICNRKNVSVDGVEDLIQGVNHTILGAKLAEKWGLPDSIVVIIRYYRLPLSSPEDLQQAAKIVYLAHTLSALLHHDSTEYQTENLPIYFGLSFKDTLSRLVKVVKESVQHQSDKQ
jgi:putative nucleotidyltransferase with HDIG domain